MAKEYEYHVFQPITTAQYQESVYKAIGQNWALLTSGNKEKANTMTVSWGGVGVLWEKDVVFVFVRDSRYTKELIDSSGVFSLSFLDHDTYLREYKYMGAASGRNEDKIAAARLHVAMNLGVPYIDEAATVILCTTVFSQVLTTDAEHFRLPGLDQDRVSGCGGA